MSFASVFPNHAWGMKISSAREAALDLSENLSPRPPISRQPARSSHVQFVCALGHESRMSTCIRFCDIVSERILRTRFFSNIFFCAIFGLLDP